MVIHGILCLRLQIECAPCWLKSIVSWHLLASSSPLLLVRCILLAFFRYKIVCQSFSIVGRFIWSHLAPSYFEYWYDNKWEFVASFVCLVKTRSSVHAINFLLLISNINSTLGFVNSHTSGVHFLKLKAWHGQWNTKLLETASTTSFTHCARYEACLDFDSLFIHQIVLVNACIQMFLQFSSISQNQSHEHQSWIIYLCLNMRSPSIYILKACLYACTWLRSMHTWTIVTFFVNIEVWPCIKALSLTHLYIWRQVICVSKKGALLTTKSQYVFRKEWSFKHKYS